MHTLPLPFPPHSGEGRGGVRTRKSLKKSRMHRITNIILIFFTGLFSAFRFFRCNPCTSRIFLI